MGRVFNSIGSVLLVFTSLVATADDPSESLEDPTPTVNLQELIDRQPSPQTYQEFAERYRDFTRLREVLDEVASVRPSDANEQEFEPGAEGSANLPEVGATNLNELVENQPVNQAFQRLGQVEAEFEPGAEGSANLPEVGATNLYDELRALPLEERLSIEREREERRKRMEAYRESQRQDNTLTARAQVAVANAGNAIIDHPLTTTGVFATVLFAAIGLVELRRRFTFSIRGASIRLRQFFTVGTQEPANIANGTKMKREDITEIVQSTLRKPTLWLVLAGFLVGLMVGIFATPYEVRGDANGRYVWVVNQWTGKPTLYQNGRGKIIATPDIEWRK